MAAMFEHLVHVRWRDTDAQGRVNHAVFLSWPSGDIHDILISPVLTRIQRVASVAGGTVPG